MNRTMAFFIFFSIVLSIYGLINYYIYVRGLQALPAGHALRQWYQWGFWVVAGFYVAGRMLEKIYISYMSDFLVWAGSFWLAAMLYFFLLLLLIDLIRLVNHLIPLYPSWMTADIVKTKYNMFIAGVAVVGLVILAGFVNARLPRIKHLDIVIEKATRHPQAKGMEEVHAVVMSDIHLGTIIGRSHFNRIVRRINALKPDIIFLPGDILDEDLQPVIRQNIGETLRQLHAPLGIYAIMGNHEHIGGAAEAYEYLRNHGLTMLRDSVVLINESFYLAGREDRDVSRFTGDQRKPLEALLAEVDRSIPLILLDHQPYYLEDAARLGVDLQLSGHTHHGQLWPLNYITSAIFTISRGYGKIGNMHAYVSNGVGTWGPPVRIGNRPEIVSLRIQFGADPS